MTRTIYIRESAYYTYQDERHFYLWLEAIPSVKSVEGGLKGLAIEIDEKKIDMDDWADMTALFVRYGIDAKPMRELVMPSFEARAKTRGTWWFIAVYGRTSKTKGRAVRRKKPSSKAVRSKASAR